MAQQLISEKIIKTLDLLEVRISERFPEAGLASVCNELTETARQTAKRVRAARRTNWLLRLVIVAVMAAGLYAQGYVLTILDPVSLLTSAERETAELAQAAESVVNLIILSGAGLWFMASLESREKRRFVLKHLHELRSIAHVIDMHQLTKDPISSQNRISRTPNSPDRSIGGFALTRYLDYCSEMLSLTGKLAALYGDQTNDTDITAAVNDIENLTSGISQKIWQKIMIISDLNTHGQGSSLASRAAAAESS